ncbi:exodeoxyribonuclease VII large subunit [Virgibacillus sp. W0181]|uniref:exodeoxyribonuclease VII large subunit n=1 Tax=Virgibacillus sp. W0181 TaxID=3391581 RepID=UPI003F460296
MRDNYLTVNALTKYIKRKMDTDAHLQGIMLKGEISNFKHHSRGHMYLTIKDNHSRIQAVMFAGNNRRLKFMPENGMEVLITGNISVFEPYGQYQLYIKHMEPDGIGSLYLAFEQLKEKLTKEGYFDKERQQIPFFPKHIGIITSPTGAAIRDIIITLQRRFPVVKTTIIPVSVQGTQAAPMIERAIQLANRLNTFDLLIVGRGGGSIEDLWAFNEEAVAKAIYHSTIPIISAVGHETDITISDFAADVRASTPTGAAEIAVPSQEDLKERINKNKQTMSRMLQSLVATHQKHLNRLKQSYAFRFPMQLTLQKEQQLDKAAERLEVNVEHKLQFHRRNFANVHERLSLRHPEKQITEAALHLKQLVKKNNTSMRQLLNHKQNQNQNVIEKLIILNPLEIMRRGFAIPYNENQIIIKSVSEVHENEQLTIKMLDGELNCHITNIREENNDY